jgi:hypothetical protein
MSKGKTIKDVALALGVSPATVSRALAGNTRIPEDTRLKVAQMAQQLGYVVNRGGAKPGHGAFGGLCWAGSDRSRLWARRQLFGRIHLGSWQGAYRVWH